MDPLFVVASRLSNTSLPDDGVEKEMSGGVVAGSRN
jgi:hypothetical protein